MSSSVDTGRARAWAWVAHLRSGGTTPWAAWEATDAGERTRFLPGAQQLELLRRLNAAGRPAPALVERVLTASAPGRGRPDLQLVGVEEGRWFGPPPVDPSSLDDAELLRVATGLLALDVLGADLPTAAPRRPRRLRTRYELAGDPWLAGGYTRALAADGRPPGGAGRSVHVLGTDVATMLAHTWAVAAFGAGAPGWREYLGKVRARRRLPRRVALDEVVGRFRARPHTGRVGVVLDPAALPRLVGVRRLAPPAEVAAHATELARQVGVALSLHVLPGEQERLLTERLLPRLAGVPGGLPVVPPEHRDWVEDAAFALRQRLLRARYPVEGDPDVVLPVWSGSPADRGNRHLSGVAPPDKGQDRPTTLDLAVELLLEVE